MELYENSIIGNTDFAPIICTIGMYAEASLKQENGKNDAMPVIYKTGRYKGASI
jgi:hypothetical protein